MNNIKDIIEMNIDDIIHDLEALDFNSPEAREVVRQSQLRLLEGVSNDLKAICNKSKTERGLAMAIGNYIKSLPETKEEEIPQFKGTREQLDNLLPETNKEI